jgi:hypothetical protein
MASGQEDVYVSVMHAIYSGLATDPIALQTGEGPHDTQLVSLFYSFSADTSTNMMSMSCKTSIQF